jgi:hypothetical protein
MPDEQVYGGTPTRREVSKEDKDGPQSLFRRCRPATDGSQ